VFKADRFVVKIFAPAESGADTEADYSCELLGMQRAMRLGVHIPRVIASSAIEDKYTFRYIIMDYIDGADAGKVLPGCSTGQKLSFVRQLCDNLQKLNTACQLPAVLPDAEKKMLSIPRRRQLPDKLFAQVREWAGHHPPSDKVYVHGDVTGGNVLITPDGGLCIIDFADGRIAPREYEYPADDAPE